MSALGCVHCYPAWRVAEYIASGQSLCSKHMAEYKKTLKNYVAGIKFDPTPAPERSK